jgi:sulfite reductase beta subunit-like hemoprotein
MPAKPQLTAFETAKLNIDPDFDFRDIGQRPFEDITTNELGMFKWSGVYHQIQTGFFMIRLRVPGGILSAEQLERAADLAEAYGQGRLCITTRQCLQFHWLRKEDIYKVIEGMEAVGILSKNACGDVTRNVVTCPLAGVCPHEITDTRKMLLRIADDDEILNQQRNLPRKHKISVAGCGRACGQTLMNCQGWYPVKRTVGSHTEIGWRFHAGGGLGPHPRMANVIFDWVPEDLVLEVARASTEAYRRHGNRRNRFAARLKPVIESMGPEAYAECVLAILRERGVTSLDRIELAVCTTADVGEDFLNGQAIIRQRQGAHAVRVRIPRGELHGNDARRLADWARRYGDAQVMLTNRQNLIFRDVAFPNKLAEELSASGYRLDGLEHLPDAVACVGASACPLAVSETPSLYRNIVSELGADAAWWNQIGPLKINLNGCPNSCAQHGCSDIGLRGNRRADSEGSEEGYSLYVGGSLAGPGHIAAYVVDVPTAEVVPSLRRMLDYYLAQRQDDTERFADFARRVGAAAFRELLVTAETTETNKPRGLGLEPLFSQVVVEAGQTAIQQTQSRSSHRQKQTAL